MPFHAGTHYSRTGCLCACHFGEAGTSHDDKKCALIAKSEQAQAKATEQNERDHMLAAEVIDLTPTSATAGDTHTAHTFSTPFGQTSRFTR